MPIIAPMVGGAIDGFVYWFFIETHHMHIMEPVDKQPTSEDDPQEENVAANNGIHMDTAA